MQHEATQNSLPSDCLESRSSLPAPSRCRDSTCRRGEVPERQPRTVASHARVSGDARKPSTEQKCIVGFASSAGYRFGCAPVLQDFYKILVLVYSAKIRDRSRDYLSRLRALEVWRQQLPADKLPRLRSAMTASNLPLETAFGSFRKLPFGRPLPWPGWQAAVQTPPPRFVTSASVSSPGG